MGYVKSLLHSLSDLKTSFSLFIPDLLMLGINVLLALGFLLINGDIFGVLLTNPGVLFKQDSGTLLNLLNSVKVQNHALKLIFSFIGFLLATFLFGAGLLSIKYTMLRDLCKHHSVSLKKAFKEGGTHFLSILQIRLFVFVLIGVVTLLLKFLVGDFLVLGGGALLVGYIFIEIALFLVNLFLLFRYPVLFLNKVSAFVALKSAFMFTLKKPKAVFFTWLTIFLVTSFFTLAIGGFFGYLAFLNRGEIGLVMLVLTLYLIRSLILLVLRLWMDIYLFEVYSDVR